MRASRIALAAATSLTAVLMLSACTAAEPASEPEASVPATAVETPAPPAAEDPRQGCPELTLGAVISPAAFSGCVSDVLASIEGYSAAGIVLEENSTVRHDPAAQAFELITDDGSMIGIGDELWVQATEYGWMLADSQSPEWEVSRLSDMAVEVQRALPGLITGKYMGDLTVTSIDEGRVTLSGEQSVASITAAGTYVLAPDWELLAASFTGSSTAQEIAADLTVTAWDTAQDITPPL